MTLGFDERLLERNPVQLRNFKIAFVGGMVVGIGALLVAFGRDAESRELGGLVLICGVFNILCA